MNQKDARQESDLNSENEDSINQNENDSSIEALVVDEQSVVRQKLVEKLKREPTEDEINTWLSEHTEGY